MTQSDLRKVFDRAGYEWVTSHVYRRTVATLMDEAGLSARQAADRLGHAEVSPDPVVISSRRGLVPGCLLRAP